MHATTLRSRPFPHEPDASEMAATVLPPPVITLAGPSPPPSARRNSLTSRTTPTFVTAPTPEPAPTVHSSVSSVVPSYPYNVSMPLSTHGPTPDDSGISTRLPSICVDYLSHDWAEDDVWTSWKAMTRHKSEIANGVRLENASWRTWAKQRGKLKTISPETLNWYVTSLNDEVRPG